MKVYKHFRKNFSEIFQFIIAKLCTHNPLLVSQVVSPLIKGARSLELLSPNGSLLRYLTLLYYYILQTHIHMHQHPPAGLYRYFYRTTSALHIWPFRPASLCGDQSPISSASCCFCSRRLMVFFLSSSISFVTTEGWLPIRVSLTTSLTIAERLTNYLSRLRYLLRQIVRY